MKADFFIKKEAFTISNKQCLIDGMKKLIELGKEIKQLEDHYWVHHSFYELQIPSCGNFSK